MIKVLKNMVALRQLETLQSLSDTLYIPDTIEEGTRKCEVMAVGPGYTDEHGKFHGVDVQVGDIVFCSRYSGQILKAGDDERDVDSKYLIVRNEDIIAVFSD